METQKKKKRKKEARNDAFDNKELEETVPGPKQEELDATKKLYVHQLDNKQILEHLFSTYA